MSNPFDTQVGGNHYKKCKIQPAEYTLANNLGYCEGTAIKYLTRWKDKGGITDLRKAIHYIEMLIEIETSKQQSTLKHSSYPYPDVGQNKEPTLPKEEPPKWYNPTSTAGGLLPSEGMKRIIGEDIYYKGPCEYER